MHVPPLGAGRITWPPLFGPIKPVGMGTKFRAGFTGGQSDLRGLDFFCGRRLELPLELLLEPLHHSVAKTTTCVMMLLNCPEKTVSSDRQRGAAGAQMVSSISLPRSLYHTHTYAQKRIHTHTQFCSFYANHSAEYVCSGCSV